jgi:signal transduction histidine kinase
MSDGLTKTEAALLEALQRERLLLQQRDWVSGIILHELSNAAMVLGGSADLLGSTTPGLPAHNLALLKLQQGSGTLGQLIAGLRELIDSTGSAPEFSELNIVEFVRGLIADPLLLDSAGVRRISITVRGADPSWRISSRLMRHALGNLLRNALRYSPPGSRITLTIGARYGRRWIHVRNDGHRISPEVLARLFVPGKKSDTGGMGLGLYIAQTCAERMGGRLVFGTTTHANVFSIVLEDTVAPPVTELSHAAGLAS